MKQRTSFPYNIKSVPHVPLSFANIQRNRFVLLSNEGNLLLCCKSFWGVGPFFKKV